MNTIDIILNVMVIVSMGIYAYWISSHQLHNEEESVILMIIACLTYIISLVSLALTPDSESDRTHIPLIMIFLTALFTALSAITTRAKYIGDIQHDRTLLFVLALPITSSILLFYVEAFLHDIETETITQNKIIG